MKLKIVGTDRISRYAAEMEFLANATPREMAGVLNRIGPAIRTAMVAAETAQTGLKRGVIGRALKAEPASAGGLSYGISSEGGAIRAKFFSPAQTGSGVTAQPWGVPTDYKSAFIMGGRFPNLRKLAFGGEVLMRAGAGRGPLKSVKTDVVIPEAMTKGETLAAFDQGTAQVGEAVVNRLAELLPK